MSDRAIFLDRDGTVVQPRHYPSRPEHLVLYDGILPGLRTLQSSGFRLVLITNQSGIARGLFTEDDLAVMHASLRRELEDAGVYLDGIYYCPHHIEGCIPDLAVDCDCRKPRPGMLLRAASEMDLDLGRSWFLGDILDDVEAGNRAGTWTVLVDVGTEDFCADPIRMPTHVARDTVHALAIVAAVEGLGPHTDLSYIPPSWPPLYRPAGVAHAGG